MYRVRYLEQTDKMSQQVHLRMLEEVYSRELLLACLQHSPKREQKKRRLQHFTALSVLWFLLAMVLWSRLAQARVWDKLTHWLQDRCPEQPEDRERHSGEPARVRRIDHVGKAQQEPRRLQDDVVDEDGRDQRREKELGLGPTRAPPRRFHRTKDTPVKGGA